MIQPATVASHFVIPREGSFFDFCHPDGSAASSYVVIPTGAQRSGGPAVRRQRCQVRSPLDYPGQVLRLYSDATRPLFTQDDNFKKGTCDPLISDDDKTQEGNCCQMSTRNRAISWILAPNP